MHRWFVATIIICLCCSTFELSLKAHPEGACEVSYDEYEDSPDVEIAGRHYPAVSILVNGQETEARGFVRAGRTYLPAREALEKLGATVAWSKSERAFYAQFRTQERTIRVAVGSPTASIHRYAAESPFGAGQRIGMLNMQAQPFLAEGTVFVPIRGAAEAAGAAVQYDARTRVVSITSPRIGTNIDTEAAR